MNTIDLSSLYRNSIGFDRFASLINHSVNNSASTPSYPPNNIEELEENRYAITAAVAGFSEADLDIHVEKSVLTVQGKKTETPTSRFLHQGIANRAFERKFNLADHIEITHAHLTHGLLVIELKREIPEAAKPQKINIHSTPAAPNTSLERSTKEAANSQCESAA